MDFYVDGVRPSLLSVISSQVHPKHPGHDSLLPTSFALSSRESFSLHPAGPLLPASAGATLLFKKA